VRMTYVDKIIVAFGGTRPMAAEIDKSPSTVNSWKARGSIPDPMKTLIMKRAKARGIELTRSDFFPDMDSSSEASNQ